jgi:enterochelin esterase-like enzyme
MLSTVIIATTLLAIQGPVERPKLPYEVLPVPAEAAQLVQKLGSSESLVSAQGEVLTILHRSAKPVQTMGGIAMETKPLPGADIQVIQLKMNGGWDEALMSVGFFSPENPKIDVEKILVFRGSKAPGRAVRAKELKGKIEIRMVASKNLGEERGVTVYLPPSASQGIPAFYMADGQGAKEFAEVLEPLILSGKMQPVAIVGVHSGTYKGDRSKPYDPKLDDRGRDYVYNTDPAWFTKHMAFFTQEVPAYVEKEFGISGATRDRAVLGFSNGGAFTAALSVLHPDFARATIPLSVGVPPDFPKPTTPLPRIYAAAGKLEPGFLFGTNRFVEQARSWGATVDFDQYMGGHDNIQWERVVAETAPKIFPPR